MPFVVSGLASGTEYTTYETVAGGKMVPVGSIHVNGGAGVADRRTLVTPRGVVTSVTEEEAARLKTDPVFQIHEKNGLVTILNRDPRDADKAARDFDRDKSAQVTDADYKARGRKAPKTGKAE